jgi:hypothetical protein
LIVCDAPGCRAGVVHVGDWGEPCKTCGGLGFLHVAALARLIDESEATLTKIMRLKGNMRPKVCKRILDKICKIVWPRQPQLFQEAS